MGPSRSWGCVKNYPESFEYVEAQVNVLDEITQSYFYKGNPKLDQTKHTAETWDHEFVDLKMIMLFSKVRAFCEEERHAIMDFFLMPFHIKVSIARHVEL